MVAIHHVPVRIGWIIPYGYGLPHLVLRRGRRCGGLLLVDSSIYAIPEHRRPGDGVRILVLALDADHLRDDAVGDFGAIHSQGYFADEGFGEDHQQDCADEAEPYADRMPPQLIPETANAAAIPDASLIGVAG